MSAEVLLISLILFSIVFALISIYWFSIKRARQLISFLKKYGDESDVDLYFWECDNTVLYFQKAVLVAKYKPEKEGVLLHSPPHFNVLIPWSIIPVIRIVDYKGDYLANLRIATPNGVERRLTMEWKNELIASIPENVSVIRG